MFNQLRKSCEITILKSPHLRRCKFLLYDEASQLNNLKLSSRNLGGHANLEWNHSNLDQSLEKKFKNPVSCITKEPKVGNGSLGIWGSILQSDKRVMFSQTASMSYDSSNKVHNTIHNLIANSKKPVFVFMKGVPSEPLCRYSGVVVQILDAYGVDYDSCDVLENEEIRQEIKSYSDWPTIPQVYKDGQFVGGCDILLQMHQSGELKQLFGDGSGDDKDQKS